MKARLLRRDVDRINVAVAGLGKMGMYHVKALQCLAGGEAEEYYKSGLAEQTSKVRICGVCDSSAVKSAGIAPEIPFYADWEKLLSGARPDLAIIATPTRTHFRLALQALESGVHTFVEKPLVGTISEFRTLSRLSDANGCRLMSGHVERYNPVAIKLRSMIASGEIEASDYRFHRSQPHDVRISDDILTDKLVHDLDLAQYFFGEIKSYSLVNARNNGEMVHEATVRICHASGLTGELFVSWIVGDGCRCREIRIGGSRRILGDFAGKKLYLDGQIVPCSVPSWVKPENNQIKDEIADFISYCMVPDGNMPEFQPLLQTWEIAGSIEIIENLVRQAKIRKEATLDV